MYSKNIFFMRSQQKWWYLVEFGLDRSCPVFVRTCLEPPQDKRASRHLEDTRLGGGGWGAILWAYKKWWNSIFLVIADDRKAHPIFEKLRSFWKYINKQAQQMNKLLSFCQKIVCRLPKNLCFLPKDFPINFCIFVCWACLSDIEEKLAQRLPIGDTRKCLIVT